MYQLTLHCNKLITTVTWWTECWLLCILELVFFICLFRWKSFCCNTNWSIVSCVAILWETLAKGMKHNQSGFYLSFQEGRVFLNVDAKDLSSRKVWLHGPQQKKFRNVYVRKCFLKGYWQGDLVPCKTFWSCCQSSPAACSYKQP